MVLPEKCNNTGSFAEHLEFQKNDFYAFILAK